MCWIDSCKVVLTEICFKIINPDYTHYNCSRYHHCKFRDMDMDLYFDYQHIARCQVTQVLCHSLDWKYMYTHTVKTRATWKTMQYIFSKAWKRVSMAEFIQTLWGRSISSFIYLFIYLYRLLMYKKDIFIYLFIYLIIYDSYNKLAL